jgi:REP element-mobilizing transposase RayT
MTTYKQIIYHIVFRTKYGKKTLPLTHCDELYKYIWGIIKEKGCVLYRINGMEDHVHILSDLHPSVALANYLRDIKTASSLWLKAKKEFPDFEGWADGYGAFTYSIRDKDMIVNYIKNQREHHKEVKFEDELRKLLEEHGVVVNEKYFP